MLSRFSTPKCFGILNVLTHKDSTLTEFHTSVLTVFSPDETTPFVSFSKFHVLGHFKTPKIIKKQGTKEMITKLCKNVSCSLFVCLVFSDFLFSQLLSPVCNCPPNYRHYSGYSHNKNNTAFQLMYD